ncbi:MAG: type II secretion system protein [Desulfovibrionales bacterium]|nr:type II secretion system protein [Desulfovibrionales bacterium]
MEMNNQEKGFTLVELLVTMAIMGLIVAGIYNLFDVHNRMAAKQEETTLMQQELLSLMVMMSDELRMCGFTANASAKDAKTFGFAHRPGANDPDSRRITSTTQIYCTLDGLGNGIINEGGNGSSADHVAYALNVNGAGNPDTSSAHRNIVKKYYTGAANMRWQPAATNIRELNFTYFDVDGVEITNPSANLNEIRSIQINATATASPERSGMNIPDRQMSSTVFCRNMAGR